MVSVNELIRNLVVEYSYYRIHAVAVFFPKHNRENNAKLETFCLIVALEATNSNSVCMLSQTFTDQRDLNANQKSMTKLLALSFGFTIHLRL